MPRYTEEQFLEVSVKVLPKLKIAHVIGKAGSDGDGKACRGTNSAAQRLRYGDPRSDDSIPKQLLVRPTEHHMGRPGIMKV